MELGLFAINYGTCGDPESAIAAATYAESAGFESVWTGEHVVLPSPKPEGFTMAPTLPFLDTTVALTLLASHTTTVKIASGITILPLRNPVLLAKELASVDVVSNGRLIVGVGAGYVAPEFAAVGVPLSERDVRMDEYIGALRSLWTAEQPEYRGQYVTILDVDAHPRPVQRPCPPIIVGGESKAALVRAITAGEGWYGFYLQPSTVRGIIATLRRLASEYERPAQLGQLSITVTPSGKVDRALIHQYEDLGVERLVVLPQPDAASDERHLPVPLDRIKRNIDTVVRELTVA